MKKIITLFFTIALLFSCKDKKKEDAIKVIEGTAMKETQAPVEIIKQVTAKNGLNFRNKPKGKVISKFKYKAKLSIIKYTGIKEDVTDKNGIITGEWVGVKYKKDTVYVFDGFLATPEKETPQEKGTTNPIDEAMLDAYIIKPGKYHGNEIPDGMTTDNWWGIFNDNGNYSVAPTPIRISKVHDAISDNKNEKTGKQIVAETTKNCYLLMNNISYLTEKSMDTVLTKPMVIHPTKPYTFKFNNIDYSLVATAKDYESLNLDVNYFKAEGYKLYLEKNKNGVITKQLLVFERYFDDQMIQVLFIGDIDGDTFPDLLIDSSNHYNVSKPTLYLSKEADKEKILKIVSLHTSVGS